MVSLRLAQLTDAFDLARNCFPGQALDEVRGYLSWCLAQQAQGRLVRLVAEVDGQAVANGQLTLLHCRGEIGSLVVAKSYQQRGIGTALVLTLVEHARAQKLRTVEISSSADASWVRAWYERLGFVYQGDHTFPGPERVAILQMTLNDNKETSCPTTKA